MLLVIFGHLWGGLSDRWNFEFVNGFHLVTFFLLSGYTLKKKELSAEYVGQKFSRLMKPYFFTCLAVMIFDLFNARIFVKDSSIMTVTGIIFRDLLRSFYASGSYTVAGTAEMGTRIGAIWFFPAIFFALIIFQSLLHLTDDYRRLGLYSLITAAAGHLSARFVWLPFSIQSGMMAVFFLYLGYMMRQKDLLSHVQPADYIIAAVLLFTVIRAGYCAVFFVTANIRDYLLSMVGALSGFLLIYLVSRLLEKAVILPKIGQYSSTVLCMHLLSLECMSYTFNILLDNTFHLSGDARAWAVILVYMVFAVTAAFCFEWFKGKWEKRKTAGKTEVQSKRDTAVDIAKGILILLMLVGHFDIDPGLRKVIYSFHMAGFVFFSGYFYRSSKSIGQTLKRMCRTFLVPYGAAVILKLLTLSGQWSPEFIRSYIQQYAMGISFAKNLFPEIGSVGPIYFILLLFCTRVIYTVTDHLISERKYKYLTLLCIVSAGYYLGAKGYWLPWSLDAACFCAAFYWLGVLSSEYHVLQYVKTHSSMYFFLSCIWAYMIFQGSMELAQRDYGKPGLCILGSFAGTLLVYMMSAYIGKKKNILSDFLSLAGSSTLYILVIHTVFRKEIYILTGIICHEGYFGFFLVSILLQTLLGILVFLVVSKISNLRSVA